MNLTLSQKERLLLEDQKSHEEICIKKYNSYANQAQDPELKQMFRTFAMQEQQHLDTINQMLNGQVPNMQQGQSQQSQQQINSSPSRTSSRLELPPVRMQISPDMLMTEKYVSST